VKKIIRSFMSIQNKVAAMTARIEAERPPAPRPPEVPPLVRMPRSVAGELLIAKVVSDATGGGYYNCYLQTIDATYWGTDTSALTNAEAIPVSIVVLNLAEVGSSVHDLAANDLIVCWVKTDDEGNSRYEGLEINGRHTFGEWT
ncbi:MAG: hypothetical protein PHW13_14085, partial [Methylococcales bacterium]|nr:hypothetical protein [Methylococcales bacterium]